MASIKKYKTDKGTFWSLRGFIGYRDDGREIRVNRKGFATKKEAQQVLAKMQLDFEKGKLTQSKVNLTFQQLYDLWLEQYRLQVKPSSVATARRYCELHVLPKFGNLKLNSISISYCQKVVNEWYNKYKQYAYLKKETQKILKYGVAIEVLETNPMTKVSMPRKKEVDEPIKFYTKEELKTFLDHCKSNCSPKLYMFFRLLAFTGVRKSEALALNWSDIDFSSNNLSIGKTLTIDEHGSKIIQQPKTINSIRFIKLDAITVDLLNQWASIQKQELLTSTKLTSSKQCLVFSNKFNELYYPQVANDWLNWVYEKYDLLDASYKKKCRKEYDLLSSQLDDECTPVDQRTKEKVHLDLLLEELSKTHIPLKRITIHGFRYTHCSLLFEAQASIKEVQARLGHKDVQTTMNIYACVTPKMIEDTGEKFSQYVGF